MEIKTLSELSIGGKGNYGIAASAVPYSNDLYTYLRITDITDDGNINFDSLMSVADENANKYILEPNDIVFARTGESTGRNYFYDGTDGKFVYAGFLIKFSIDPQKVVPKYIKYYCQSDEYKGWIQSYISGSTRGNINAKTYGLMPIPIPNIEQQKGIVSLLSSIDCKIKLNNEINKNLQLQAQTLFIAWFETFEPFDGVVPDSWKQITLGDIAEIKTNSFNPQKNPDVLIEHYSIPAFDENKYPVFEYSSGVKSNKYILSNNSVMISKLNPDTKRVWRPLCLSDFAVSSTEFIIFEPYNPKYKDYVYSIIDSQGFTDWMCSHTTGSTNSRQRTTPATTLNYNLWMPDDESIEKFLNAVTPMYDLISQNLCQNQELVSLRDSLLPKLMSGELDVSNIDI